MKILAIGNSFSQDATAYIEDIAVSCGHPDIIAANLYIPGCPLSRHAENLQTNAMDYEYQRHGEKLYKANIRDTLSAENWDVVTMQQVSGLSGIESSFHPYIEEVYHTVRSACPRAQILLHRTWAYETGSTHSDFVRYENNRGKMDDAIEAAYQKLSKELSLSVIPVGNIISALIKMPEFNPECGGISLYRDKFHLSLTYGRYAAACVWLRTICGLDIGKDIPFMPEKTESELLSKIRCYINEALPSFI